ncbi:hypothetical protein WN865_01200 [Tetragenococcus halophilus]
MNFGQNLWNWFSGNAQPLVLMGIAAIGLYMLLERKMSKVVGLVIIAVVVVGFVFFTSDVKDLLGNLFNEVFK